MEKIINKYKDNIAKLKEVLVNTDDEFVKTSIHMLVYRIRSKIEEIEDEGEEVVYLGRKETVERVNGRNRRVR